MQDEPQVLTSYYGNYVQIMKHGWDFESLVNISRFPPAWFPGRSYRLLSPDMHTEELFRQHKLTRYTYKRRMQDQLNALNAEDVLKDLLQGRDRVILLCDEAPPLFCHRSMVAQWLHDQTGCRIGELPA